MEHNLTILKRLGELKVLGMPILVGASRKWFIGQLTGQEADDRVEGSVSAAVAAVWGGADIVRVHDVAETIAAVRVSHSIARADRA